MDSADYIPMFLSEAQEHLQELNLAVVRLEERPDDRATIDEIFRIAHSLKGMSATMGFSAVAKLTHEMENVFETLRQRHGALSREVVDTVLACLDALSAAIDAVETTGAEKLDPEPLIARLHSLARSEDTPPPSAGPAEDAAIVDPPLVQTAAADGTKVLRVVVDLVEEVSMPSVRAFMAFSTLADYGELIATQPPVEEIEDFRGQRFAAWLLTEHDAAKVMEAVGMVSDVAEVQASDVVATAPPSATPDTATDQPEVPEASEAGATRTARTVRVDAERLDQLMHYMGEVVIQRTSVEVLAAQAQMPELSQAVQELARSSQALQAMVMQVRMIPVEAVFLRFPRLVRDLSSKLDKQVELRLVGKDTELDRTVVDALGDPLVHLVRNSLDHGLETPAERKAAGKPETGVLEIAARHAGSAVVIEVRDDGHGIDPAKVAKVAVDRGLIAAEAADLVDMPRAIELLFTPGFSTATVTSDISGRGVGMDAVRAKIRELGGEILMTSVTGQGTTSEIRLPLTLAILAALIIEVQGQAFAIPLERVERTLRLDETIVRTVAGRRVLALDDGVLTLLDGSEAFALATADTECSERAVIVSGQEGRLAIAVNALVGQRELVTRPLPGVLGQAAAVSGGAVLSDGRIALIVDCDALMARVTSRSSDPTRAAVGLPTPATSLVSV